MTFSEKLLNLRTERGYSQEYLAEQLGVSRQSISKWELGTTLPEIDKLISISDFFDVSIDYLLKSNVKLQQDDSFDRVVLKFLASAQDMDEISKELVDIIKDGVIDSDEMIRMASIIDTLDEISRIIGEIKRKMCLGSNAQLRKDHAS